MRKSLVGMLVMVVCILGAQAGMAAEKFALPDDIRRNMPTIRKYEAVAVQDRARAGVFDFLDREFESVDTERPDAVSGSGQKLPAV